MRVGRSTVLDVGEPLVQALRAFARSTVVHPELLAVDEDGRDATDGRGGASADRADQLPVAVPVHDVADRQVALHHHDAHWAHEGFSGPLGHRGQDRAPCLGRRAEHDLSATLAANEDAEAAGTHLLDAAVLDGPSPVLASEPQPLLAAETDHHLIEFRVVVVADRLQRTDLARRDPRAAGLDVDLDRLHLARVVGARGAADHDELELVARTDAQDLLGGQQHGPDVERGLIRRRHLAARHRVVDQQAQRGVPDFPRHRRHAQIGRATVHAVPVLGVAVEHHTAGRAERLEPLEETLAVVSVHRGEGGDRLHEVCGQLVAGERDVVGFERHDSRVLPDPVLAVDDHSVGAEELPERQVDRQRFNPRRVKHAEIACSNRTRIHVDLRFKIPEKGRLPLLLK